MLLILVGLTAYIIHIPILITIFSISKHKHKGYSLKKFWVSQLGEKSSPNYRWFNLNVTIFGLLAFFFVTAYRYLLPDILLSKIGLFFLYLTCLSTTLIGIFPRDTQPKAHTLTSFGVFPGIIGSAIFTLYPIYYSSQIPNWTIIINLIILLSFPMLALTGYYDKTKKQAKGILKKLVIKNKGVWEWTACLSAISWDFIMAATTLKGLI